MGFDVYMYVYICVCMCVYVYVYMCVCVYICLCACVYMCICVCMGICVYADISVKICDMCLVYSLSDLPLTSIVYRQNGPTSRGKELEHHLSPDNFNIPKRIITISGASLDTLTSEATRIINTHPTPHKIHTYFIAGIPDITSKINDVDYEEVLFIDNAETAHHNFMTKIKNTKEIISVTKSIPCFATIAPMSLHTCNTTRMSQHKTQYLIHHNYYEDMQSLLIQAIIKINASIIQINDESNMHTPN